MSDTPRDIHVAGGGDTQIASCETVLNKRDIKNEPNVQNCQIRYRFSLATALACAMCRTP